MASVYTFTTAVSSYISRMSRIRFLVAVFVLAVVVRWAATVAVRDVHRGPQRQIDWVEFNILARHLAAGQGYTLADGNPTSYRAPGFPLVLAAVYVAFGAHYPVAYLSFCILGAITCVLTYWLARGVLSEAGARAACLLAVLYFPFIYFSSVYASETVFAPCLAVSVWCMLRHFRSGSWSSLAASALALGFVILTRPNAVLLLPLLLAALCWKHGWKQPHLLAKRCSVLVGIVIAVLAPWAIRNYTVHRSLVLFTTNGGATFRGGNNNQVLQNPEFWGWWLPGNELPNFSKLRQARNEVERDALEWRMGWEWIRSHPQSLPRLVVLKAVRLWLPNYSSSNHAYALLDSLGYLPYLVLFALGVKRCFAHLQWRTPEWLVLHGTLLVTILTALVFWGSPRFRDGNVAVLMIYASQGVRDLQTKLAGQLKGPRAVSQSTT